MHQTPTKFPHGHVHIHRNSQSNRDLLSFSYIKITHLGAFVKRLTEEILVVWTTFPHEKNYGPHYEPQLESPLDCGDRPVELREPQLWSDIHDENHCPSSFSYIKLTYIWVFVKGATPTVSVRGATTCVFNIIKLPNTSG